MKQHVTEDEVPDMGEPYIRPELAVRILDRAVESGLLATWADVIEYRRGQRVILRRNDTDGTALVVPVRSIRQALRRVRRLELERTGLTSKERLDILHAEESPYHISPESCELVMQLAAIGRVVYR